MATTMYLRNATEIAAAARVAKRLGYETSQADIRANDRYIINIAARLAGGSASARTELERAVVAAIKAARNA